MIVLRMSAQQLQNSATFCTLQRRKGPKSVGYRLVLSSPKAKVGRSNRLGRAIKKSLQEFRLFAGTSG
jgi:hypothetical protein